MASVDDYRIGQIGGEGTSRHWLFSTTSYRLKSLLSVAQCVYVVVAKLTRVGGLPLSHIEAFRVLDHLEAFKQRG